MSGAVCEIKYDLRIAFPCKDSGSDSEAFPKAL